MKDHSETIYKIKAELKRRGEKMRGDRAKQWCKKAGYKSVDHLDEKGLNGLLKAVMRK